MSIRDRYVIELGKENLIIFKEVTKLLPKRPNGRRLHVSCIYRWASRGLDGVKLESIRIGGTTYTSLEALQRFADARTKTTDSTVPKRSFTNKAREAQVRDATRRIRAELGLDESPAPQPTQFDNADRTHHSVRDDTAQVTENAVVDASTARKQEAERDSQPTEDKRFTA